MSVEPQGLSRAEALAALARFGANELRPPTRHAWLRRAGRVLREPTLLALLAVLALYVSMGSSGEATLLGLFVVLVVSVTYVEETRTEQTVEALGHYASPRAMALRDGVWTRLAGPAVVPGDLLRLQEGDRIPADLRILEAHDLRTDESFLTGESASVVKQEDDGEASLAWAGSMILGGQGLGRVLATGLDTRVGKLSRSLGSIEPDPTPFQAAADRVVRWLGFIGLGACLTVVAVGWKSGLGWAPALLQGLTLAITLVPEELPVILTVFMAMGSRRLAKLNVLVQRLPAVETLGAISILAVDKTGTLTENRMGLAEVLVAPGTDEAALLAAAARASEPDPFDPMEKAILERSGKPRGSLLKEYELQGRPPRMGHLWSGQVLSVKGAVVAVLEHCAVDVGAKAWALAEEVRLSKLGLRVLGVAEGQVDGLPDALPGGLKLLGLLAFEDPLRAGVREAVDACHRAGIRVVMLTGDAPQTASAIAAQAGFVRPEAVAQGHDLEDASAVASLAATHDIFARLAPEHKQALIQAWSAAGEVVAMTGDGVNDAPALAQAHVGVAMGQRGTDVAREAASVVLVDDSFISLVQGVRMGRDVTARILRAAEFVLAVHVPIVGLVLLCLLAGLPPLVSAAQVAFLELFIGPACSIVFERAESDEDSMSRPPRNPRAPFLSLRSISLAVIQGGVIFAVVAVAYIKLLHGGAGVAEARSVAFTALMLGDLALAWTLLSPAPFWRVERWNNLWFWGVSAAVMGLLELLRHIEFTAPVLGMPPLTAIDWILALGLGLIATLWNEFGKLGHRQAK